MIIEELIEKLEGTDEFEDLARYIVKAKLQADLYFLLTDDVAHNAQLESSFLQVLQYYMECKEFKEYMKEIKLRD